MLRGVTFKMQAVKAEDDAGLYYHICKDGILWGCEMNTTFRALTIESGELIIKGRVIQNDGLEEIVFNNPIQNGYGRAVVRIDTSQISTPTVFEQVSIVVDYSTTTIFPDLKQQDINNGGVSYEQEIAIVRIEDGNITGITRRIGNAIIDATTLDGKNSAAFATSAQGVKADGALLRAGGIMTGILNFLNSNIGIKSITGTHLGLFAPNGILAQVGNGRFEVKNLAGDGYMGIRCLDLLLNAALGWGGTASITGRSGEADVLILQGGLYHPLSMRASSVRVRNSADTEFADIYCKSATNPSSLRYKHTITDATDSEAIDLLKIAIKNYIYNEGDQDKIQIGVIAEELEKLGIKYPITYDVVGKPDGVDYSKFVSPLIRLCQIHQKKIDIQQKQIDNLKSLLVKKGVCTQEEIDSLEGEKNE